MREPGRSAIGTWSGGRFLHFGEAIDEDRLAVLLRPGEGIDTVLTADAYGQGEADTVLGRALAGVARDNGAGVLLCSDELSDLDICDRVVVLVRGEVFTEFTEPPFDRDALIVATEGIAQEAAE